jgi:hypothetical protein
MAADDGSATESSVERESEAGFASDAPATLLAPQSDDEPAIAAESEHQVEAEKENEMIEIHAPHESMHSWRDICIHLAIVVAGILIAIGLEQSVEYLHHRQQRNDLIRQLRAESEDNLRIFDRNQKIQIALLAWDQRSVAALRNAAPRNGMIDVTLPSGQPLAPRTVLEWAAWPLAQSNGTAALLPDNLARIYQRLDSEAVQETEAMKAYATSRADLGAIGMRLGVGLDPGTTVHLSPADRDLLIQALSQEAATLSAALLRDAYWQGACDAVAHDVSTREAMVPYMARAAIATLQAEARAGISIPGQLKEDGLHSLATAPQQAP